MPIRNVTAMWVHDQSFVYSDDDFLAGSLVSSECFIGFFMLLAVIIGCKRIPALKSPFGMLMYNQNVTQLLACFNSGTFFFLGVLLNIKFVVDHSHYSGNFSVFLLPIILGSFLMMSLNRLCASVFVFTYKKIFTTKKMQAAIVFNWVASFLACLWVFGLRQCGFVFYHYGWVITGAVYTDICRDVINVYNMYVQMSLSFLILLFDLVTLVVLLFLRKRVYSKQSTAVRRREMSFAAQVLIQGVVFLMHGFWYEMGYSWIPGNDERWKNFFTTSFSANLMHIFDPLVVFIFNPEYRKWIFSCYTKSNFHTRHTGVVSTVVASI